MSKTINTKIFLRNDTAAEWTKNNPTLGKGEIGVQIDTKKFKFGDGTTPWNSLDYGAGASIALATASNDGLLSSSDFTKIAGITAGAEPNIIEVIKKNGTALTVTNKQVNVIVPTKTSELTNDSGFITTGDIPEGAAASTTVPKMDGTATIGTELAFARGDHVHPSDTSKADKATTLAGYGITDAMTATAIEQAINTAVSSVFKYKGTKATISALPTSDNTIGDVWHVTANSSEYVWNGTDWEELGTVIDLSNYLQSVSIAGITLTPSSYTITVDQLKTALGLAAAAYKSIDTSIVAGSTSTNIPTTQAVASFVAASATKVQASATNGNIKVNNVETTVYTLPSTVLDSSDILILDCGLSTTNYS